MGDLIKKIVFRYADGQVLGYAFLIKQDPTRVGVPGYSLIPDSVFMPDHLWERVKVSIKAKAAKPGAPSVYSGDIIMDAVIRHKELGIGIYPTIDSESGEEEYDMRKEYKMLEIYFWPDDEVIMDVCIGRFLHVDTGHPVGEWKVLPTESFISYQGRITLNDVQSRIKRIIIERVPTDCFVGDALLEFAQSGEEVTPGVKIRERKRGWLSSRRGTVRYRELK